jgi:YidC/Oxa1 family membrane protein insertase
MPVLANIFQPLIDAADWLLKALHDVGFGWGMSIILLTVIVRIVIIPLTIRQIKAMNTLRALQPQLKEIQEKYKDDRQAMQQATMRFYRENKVNPFASCLPLLLQIPIFMSLFYLLRSSEFKAEAAGQGFLFIADLTAKAHGAELLALMALFVGSQVASTMVMSVTVDKTQQRIMLLLPLVFVSFIPTFPAGLILYWITTNFWTLGQQLVVRRLSPPPPLASPAPRPARRGDKRADADAEEKVPVGTGARTKAPPPPPPRKKKRRRR